MSREWEVVTSSPGETQRIARALGAACAGGELFLLAGPLGSGKTCFVQGLAQGLGVRGYVHSPTFVLVAEHAGRRTLYHADLYRIESAGEALDLALDEYIGGEGVCAIEWADREPSIFPPERLLVRLEDLGGDRRRIRLTATGPKHEALLATLAPADATGGR